MFEFFFLLYSERLLLRIFISLAPRGRNGQGHIWYHARTQFNTHYLESREPKGLVNKSVV